MPRLKKLALQILNLQSIPHEHLEIALVDDALIAHIHGEFMNDPTPTDIITFPLGQECAQLIISLETCARQARQFKNSFENELILYMIHGVLHLAGYDDHTPAQIAQMQKMEKEVMARIRLDEGKRIRGL